METSIAENPEIVMEYTDVLFFLGDSTRMPATPVAFCFNTNAIIVGSIRPTKVEP